MDRMKPVLKAFACLLMLLFVVLPGEGHALHLSRMLSGVILKRWSWGVLFSPAAAVCLGAVLASFLIPLKGIALVITFLFEKETKASFRSRVVPVAAVALFVLLLPFLTDAIIWGSFPLTVDNAGWHRLRIIPFIPWPSGGYMTF
jgi:hypothetical protein